MKVGTEDSKKWRVNLFTASTNASEKFRKLNRVTVLDNCGISGAQEHTNKPIKGKLFKRNDALKKT